MEINLRHLRTNKRIKVLTLAEGQKVDGQVGDYGLTVKLHPRFVNDNCTACGACGESVSAQINNPFGYHRYDARHDLCVLAAGMESSVDIKAIKDAKGTPAP